MGCARTHTGSHIYTKLKKIVKGKKAKFINILNLVQKLGFLWFLIQLLVIYSFILAVSEEVYLGKRILKHTLTHHPIKQYKEARSSSWLIERVEGVFFLLFEQVKSQGQCPNAWPQSVVSSTPQTSCLSTDIC